LLRALLLAPPTVTGKAALSSGVARLLTGPLVGGAFLMSGLPALACNLALPSAIHRCKPAIFFGHVVPPCARSSPVEPDECNQGATKRSDGRNENTREINEAELRFQLEREDVL
jgi:hypothetical protein